jgi:hypothetical protein
MALLAGTLSLPFSTNQATALKPRVYPFGTDQPEAAIGLGERVDFDAGELDAPLAQGPEGFERPLEKTRAELLVCQNRRVGRRTGNSPRSDHLSFPAAEHHRLSNLAPGIAAVHCRLWQNRSQASRCSARP